MAAGRRRSTSAQISVFTLSDQSELSIDLFDHGGDHDEDERRHGGEGRDWGLGETQLSTEHY